MLPCSLSKRFSVVGLIWPSWLEKDCLQFGPPIYHETIPFSKILQEVYLEAILWGIGTALGELPPYFLSRTGSVHTALRTKYNIIYLITAVFSCLSTWSSSSTLSHCFIRKTKEPTAIKEIWRDHNNHHLQISLWQSVHILGATALISLLQPAPEIYELFDDIVLLAEGQIVYQGPRENVLEFFEAMGFRCPDRKGVADFLQEVSDMGEYDLVYVHNF